MNYLKIEIVRRMRINQTTQVMGIDLGSKKKQNKRKERGEKNRARKQGNEEGNLEF